MRRDVAWGRERGLCVPGVSTRGLQRHPLHREPDRNRGALDGDNRPGCPGVVRLRRRAALIRGLLCAWARGIRRSRGLVHATVSACGTAGHPRLGGRLPAFAKNARLRCQDRRKNQHGGQWPHPTHKPTMARVVAGVKLVQISLLPAIVGRAPVFLLVKLSFSSNKIGSWQNAFHGSSRPPSQPGRQLSRRHRSSRANTGLTAPTVTSRRRGSTNEDLPSSPTTTVSRASGRCRLTRPCP